jgi:hypothetical protein
MPAILILCADQAVQTHNEARDRWIDTVDRANLDAHLAGFLLDPATLARWWPKATR